MEKLYQSATLCQKISKIFKKEKNMEPLTYQFYQEHSQEYAEKTRAMEMQNFIHRWARLLPPHAQVADLGCGAGRDLRLFKAQGLTATGIDISPKMAALAEEYSQCPVYVADLQNLPILSESQDGIWLCAVLVHLPPEQWPAALSEVLRIARDGAVVFIAVKQGTGTVRTPDGRLFWLYTQEQIHELLKPYPWQVIFWEQSHGEQDTWINVWARIHDPSKTNHSGLTQCAAYQWARWQLAQAKIDQHGFEAKWLLEYLFKDHPNPMLLDSQQLLSLDQEQQWFDLIQRRVNHCPLAYLIGTQGFLEFTFIVRPGVLIPRPETELLVLWIVQYMQQLFPHLKTPQATNGSNHSPLLNDPPQARTNNGTTPPPPTNDPTQARINNGIVEHPVIGLDLCTGSGCIAISVLKYLPKILMIASDISSDALSVCAENANMMQVQDRLVLIQGDLLDPITANHNLDFVVVNPPYISEAEYPYLMPEVRDYEPKLALLADDGLLFYRRILAKVSDYLKPHGRVILELGQGQIERVISLVPPTLQVIEIVPDFQGIARVLVLGLK